MESDRCLHGMIPGQCSICHAQAEAEKINKAVSRIMDRCERLSEGKKENIMQETKVCKKGEHCVNGPEPQPIENFQKSVLTKSGRLDICRSCMKALQRRGFERAGYKRAEKKPAENPASPANPASSAAQAQESKIAQHPHTLEIDFSKHPDLLDKLKEVARAEMRKPEWQILYWIQEKFVPVDRVIPRKAD